MTAELEQRNVPVDPGGRNLGIDLESVLARPVFYTHLGTAWRALMDGGVYLLTLRAPQKAMHLLAPVIAAHSAFFFTLILSAEHLSAAEHAMVEAGDPREAWDAAKRRWMDEFRLAAVIDGERFEFREPEPAP